MKAEQPVRISLSQLEADPHSLNDQINRALGSEPGCLGIVLIDDLPAEFGALREKLFHLAQRFGNLPPETRDTLSREDTSYSFGWSHGKEVMNGRPDTQKGSYYANPLLDRPAVSDAQRAAYPEYYAGNVWPTGIEGMEEFEMTFKALGQLVFQAGLALARACEEFVASSQAGPSRRGVESLLANSKTHKARLLHYFPEDPTVHAVSDGSGDGQLANDALCGTHKDHSLITGLCSAMYLRASPSGEVTQVSAPSPTAGLWIYPRHPAGTPQPDPVKVSIPPDCLAFQTGESLELLTAGKLAATPHFVSGSAGLGDADGKVSRETFAFFLQPDVDDVIGQDGETFGAFTKRVLGRHYSETPAQEAEN